MNLIINSEVLSKSMFSHYVGMYTKHHQELNGKKSFKRTYESWSTTQNETVKIEKAVYLYWTPATKWAVRIKKIAKLHYSISNIIL